MSQQIDEAARLLKLLQQAKRPEPIEQVVEAFGPIKDLLRRVEEQAIPLTEQQRVPSQRAAMVGGLEEDLRVVFKVLGDLENEARETRTRCTELLKVVRRLRPRGKPRPPVFTRTRAARPALVPTDEEKRAVLNAIGEFRGSASMGDLVRWTGFPMSKMKRVLKALKEEGEINRSGTTSATRYTRSTQGKLR